MMGEAIQITDINESINVMTKRKDRRTTGSFLCVLCLYAGKGLHNIKYSEIEIAEYNNFY